MIRKDIKMGYQFKPYIKEGQKMQLPTDGKRQKSDKTLYKKLNTPVVCKHERLG